MGDVIEETVKQTVKAASGTVWSKLTGWLKDNYLSILGALFGGATSSTALDKANRLFEVLTIDCEDSNGLYYIDIS